MELKINRRQFLALSTVTLFFGFSAFLRLLKNGSKKVIASADKAKVFPGKLIPHSEDFQKPAKWAG